MSKQLEEINKILDGSGIAPIDFDWEKGDLKSLVSDRMTWAEQQNIVPESKLSQMASGIREILNK